MAQCIGKAEFLLKKLLKIHENILEKNELRSIFRDCMEYFGEKEISRWCQFSTIYYQVLIFLIQKQIEF